MNPLIRRLQLQKSLDFLSRGSKATLSILILGIAIAAALLYAVKQNTYEGATIVRLPKKSRNCCLVNEPVILEVGAKNILQTPFNYIKRGMLMNYFSFDIKTKDGDDVPLTRYGKGLLNAGDAGGIGVITIEPGKEFVAEVVISQIYDFSAPGEYTIIGTVKGETSHGGRYKSSRTLEVRIRQ